MKHTGGEKIENGTLRKTNHWKYVANHIIQYIEIRVVVRFNYMPMRDLDDDGGCKPDCDEIEGKGSFQYEGKQDMDLIRSSSRLSGFEIRFWTSTRPSRV